MRTLGTIAPLAGVLLAVGCAADGPTDPPATLGHLIARDSLTTVDGTALPCCTLTGGTLEFYGPASYTDTVYTPGGPMARECVQGVPNGAHLALNGLVTLPDSTSYLIFGCSAGAYVLVVTRQVAGGAGGAGGGGGAGAEDTVSEGAYSWKRDTLTLVDRKNPRRFSTSLAGAMVTVSAPDHQYVFEAVRAR
jgi:hypothetical protein